MPRCIPIVATVILVALRSAPAADIEVKPGEATISAAAKKAKKGDTLKLDAGTYTDRVRLPAGVTLAGAGADKTKVIGTDFTIISAGGAEIRVTGIAFEPGKSTKRGIDSEAPIRVECCRFNGFDEGVNLRGAPLSDVICCEFIDCQVGVRAYARASPTIWGCLFKGGGMGAGCLDGGPYIRNNLFTGQQTGLMIATEQPMIVRNNVFWKCSVEGIRIDKRGKFPLAFISVRNNLFDDCDAAIVAPKELLSSVSHCVCHGGKAPAIRTPQGEAGLEQDKQHIASADPKLELKKDGTFVARDTSALARKGIRLWNEPEGTAGDIGLAPDWKRPGCRPTKPDALPEVRFGREKPIANCVGEEYDLIQYRKMKIQKQSLFTENGARVDVVECIKGSKTVKLTFDIDRFFGEMSVKP